MPRILAEAFTVTPESIDLNGHVNNQEYVRWMQEIATAHSHEQGWTVARYMDTKTTWVIRSHFIEYVRPAFAGDELMVATWVAGMDKQTSPRKYRFVRVRDGGAITDVISSGERRAVACTLGGADMKTLYCLTFAGEMKDIGKGMRASRIETTRVVVAGAGSP